MRVLVTAQAGGAGWRALSVAGMVSRLRGEAPGPREAAAARVGITDARVGVVFLRAVDVLGGAV